MENYLMYIFMLSVVMVFTGEIYLTSRAEEFKFLVLADPQAWLLDWNLCKDAPLRTDWNKCVPKEELRKRTQLTEKKDMICFYLDSTMLTRRFQKLDYTDKEKWILRSRELIGAINSLRPTPDFGIINGDLTDFGYSEEWYAFLVEYSKSNIALFMGLGNHDYQNNVNDCWNLNTIWDILPNTTIFDFLKGPDACAISSVEKMERFFETYKHALPRESNFRVDFLRPSNSLLSYLKLINPTIFVNPKLLDLPATGSLSYSFDWKGVHFVQLQNFPTYEEELIQLFIVIVIPLCRTRYYIVNSLAWLDEDLRLARERGIQDIIINFHQVERLDEKNCTSPEDQKYFLQIMEKYKPVAVFTGHTHCFYKWKLKDLFGDTPVYVTAAAFLEKFHFVEYRDGRLRVSEMLIENGELKVRKVHEQGSRVYKRTCRYFRAPAPRGTIFSSSFLPKEGTYWNIYNKRNDQKYLASDRYGEVYMIDHGPENNYLRWSFDKVVLDPFNERPEFFADYQIRNQGTNMMLSCDSDGNLATKKASENDISTHWKILKTKSTEFMLIHRDTDLVLASFLDQNNNTVVNGISGLGAKIFSDFSWEIIDSKTGEICENVRFFKALSRKSGTLPLPKNNESNKYWDFVGYHNNEEIPPCVGW